ncbi:hypothetical protein DV735_g2268, partial [Chaetothyriales sp. CBS 134920]
MASQVVLDRNKPAATSPGVPLPPPAIGLPDLPTDILLHVLQYLQIWEIVRCQCVATRAPYELRSQGLHDTTAHEQSVKWKDLARSVASRYYHLSHGKPTGRLYYQNAAPHLGGMQTKPYLFRPSLWTYSDGLLVFAPAPADDDTVISSRTECKFSLLDLNTMQQVPVPFSVYDRVIRNIRLADRVLVIEWTPRKPFYSLNVMEKVHRHFVTCFDVKFDQASRSWIVEFRSEFKNHILGFSLNSQDRFFSVHNARHYVVYFYEPNSTIYGAGRNETPVESLTVWDISSPSAYQPSADLSGKKGPPTDCGPCPVVYFSVDNLDAIGVRQHSQIKLMSLGVDSEASNIIWRENVYETASGYFDPAERDWRAQTTIFPFLSFGPHQYKERDGYLPPYRGHASMESCDVEQDAIEKWFVPVMDVLDDDSGVRFSLVETVFSGLGVEQKLLIRVKVPWLGESGEYVVLRDDALVKEITAMGRIAGDERHLIGMNDKMELIVCHF